MVYLQHLESYQLAKDYTDHKRSVLPPRYVPDNRNDKIADLKIKKIKLEEFDNNKRMVIQRLLSDLSPLELSDSDIDEQQDMVEEVPLLDKVASISSNAGRPSIEATPLPAVIAKQHIGHQFIEGTPMAAAIEATPLPAVVANTNQHIGHQPIECTQMAASVSNVYTNTDAAMTDGLAGPIYKYEQNVVI